jgi:hypothetical protein
MRRLQRRRREFFKAWAAQESNETASLKRSPAKRKQALLESNLPRDSRSGEGKKEVGKQERKVRSELVTDHRKRRDCLRLGLTARRGV